MPNPACDTLIVYVSEEDIIAGFRHSSAPSVGEVFHFKDEIGVGRPVDFKSKVVEVHRFYHEAVTAALTYFHVFFLWNSDIPWVELFPENEQETVTETDRDAISCVILVFVENIEQDFPD